jgi:TPR repeat protein
MSKYQKKMLIICSVLITLGILYYFYQDEIYLWSCNKEETPASCTIVGLNYEEKGEWEKAEPFYKKSCELKYGPGCAKMAKLLEETDRKKESIAYHQKACKLSFQASCKILKKE